MSHMVLKYCSMTATFALMARSKIPEATAIRLGQTSAQVSVRRVPPIVVRLISREINEYL